MLVVGEWGQRRCVARRNADTVLGPHKIKELLMCNNKKQTLCARDKAASLCTTEPVTIGCMKFGHIPRRTAVHTVAAENQPIVMKMTKVLSSEPQIQFESNCKPTSFTKTKQLQQLREVPAAQCDDLTLLSLGQAVGYIQHTLCLEGFMKNSRQEKLLRRTERVRATG